LPVGVLSRYAVAVEVSLRLLLPLPLLLVACNDNEVHRASTTDEFQQAPSNQVDILWVIDNSVSMQNEQSNVALGAEDFIGNLESTDMDFHLGIITTDVDRTNDNAGVLLGNPKVLSAETTGYADAFRARVMQGTTGSDQEKGLQAVVSALSAPLADGPNDGFLRDGAMLSVVFLTDENDCSDNGALGADSTGEDCYTQSEKLTPVSDLVREISDIKKGDPVVLSGIIGPAIIEDCGGAVPGRRYATAIEMFGGVQADICQTDYFSIMNALGEVASGILTVFQLEHSAIEDSIEVTVTPDGGDPAVVIQDDTNGWSYISEYAQIEFHGNAVPPRGATIEVSYEIAGQVETEAPTDTDTDAGTP
jgi:hypothetical protein